MVNVLGIDVMHEPFVIALALSAWAVYTPHRTAPSQVCSLQLNT